jgi:hypothetical protein
MFPDYVRSAKTVTVLLNQMAYERDPSIICVIADTIAVSRDATLAECLYGSLTRLSSDVSRRQLINAIGSLIGGEDAFYAYMALEPAARDDTIMRFLNGIVRQSMRGNRPGGIRIAARIRRALNFYTAGDLTQTANRISTTVPYLRRMFDDTYTGQLSIIDVIGGRCRERQSVSPDEVLLQVYVLRLLMNNLPSQSKE